MKISNQEFTHCWYAYQVKMNQVPGFLLRTRMNGLEVNHQWGQEQEIAAKMAADGFVAPELNQDAVNAAQAEGEGGTGN
jgi:hypothetical protein